MGSGSISRLRDAGRKCAGRLPRIARTPGRRTSAKEPPPQWQHQWWGRTTTHVHLPAVRSRRLIVARKRAVSDSEMAAGESNALEAMGVAASEGNESGESLVGQRGSQAKAHKPNQESKESKRKACECVKDQLTYR